jgi:hypothetical protein
MLIAGMKHGRTANAAEETERVWYLQNGHFRYAEIGVRVVREYITDQD